jgi:hypothetical protein
VAEAVGEFHRLVVGDIIGVGFAFVAEVVAVGAAWVISAIARTEVFASVPASEGS